LMPDSVAMQEWYETTLPVDPEFIRYEKIDSSKVPVWAWRGIMNEGRVNEFGRRAGEIKAPILLVYGTHDNFFTKADQEALRESIPSVKYVEYPTAGHNIPYELPKEFASDVNDFLGGE